MKILILCNGRPPALDLFLQVYGWADFFIAADGGGNVARSFSHPPDVVVGDLDSFVRREQDSFEVLFNPDQETNDLEKALDVAKAKNAEEVIVLGATGRRLDQTLKNLSVIRQYNSCFPKLMMKDEFNDVFILPKTYSAELPVGTPVSLFPLSGIVRGIKTEGLKYRLNDEALENGVRDGSSNLVTGSPVTITHKQGDLVLLIVHGNQ